MRRALATVVLGALVLGAPAVGLAQSATPYALARGSQLEEGCFPPCMCPILLWSEVRGTFRLTPSEKREPGSPFEVFDVSDVRWSAKSGDRVVTITGSGTYRRGGEFALMHQLTADLAIDGAPARRFDSGLVPGGGEFPAIALRISLNGEVCYDTVIQVIAKPFVGCG